MSVAKRWRKWEADDGGLGNAPRGRETTLSAFASNAATGHAVEWVAAFESSEKVEGVGGSRRGCRFLKSR